MLGWTLWHALAYALAAVGIAVAARRCGAAFALIIGAAVLAAMGGLSISLMGKSFSAGLGAAAAEPGISVLAASMLAALAKQAGAQGVLARFARRRRFSALLAPGLGLCAGAGASLGSGLAFCMPLAASVGGGRRRLLTLALTANAAHGLLLPAPPLIAATVILGADWRLVLALGAPLALCSAGLAALLSRAASEASPLDTSPIDASAFAGEGVAPSVDPAPAPGGLTNFALGRKGAWAAIGLVAATLIVLALLSVRSLGDIPSEPFGGGSAREMVLGVGRPLPLLLAGLFVMLVFSPASTLRPGGAFAAAIQRAAPLVVALAAAGGLQSILQDTRVAESLAEYLGTRGWGLAAPFLMAAVFRALQAAPLTAAIATAGILGPNLGAHGPALAALAVGAGSTALINVNDPVFWLAAASARLRPAAALAMLSLGTMVQALLVLAVLLIAASFT